MNLLDRFDEYVIHKIFSYLEDDLYVMNSLMLIGPRYKRLIHKHLYKNQGFSDHIIGHPNYDDRIILDPKNKRANLKQIVSERDIVFTNIPDLKTKTLEEMVAHHACHDIDINNPLESFSSSSIRPSLSVVLKDHTIQIDERDSQSRYYPIPGPNNLGTIIIQDESIQESINESYESQLTKFVNKREETLSNEISPSRKCIYRDMYVGTGPFTIKSNDPL